MFCREKYPAWWECRAAGWQNTFLLLLLLEMARIYVAFVLEIRNLQFAAYGLGTPCLLAFVLPGFLPVHISAQAKIEPLLLQHFTEFFQLK